MESHRLNRELQKQRELAEQAESSRLAELKELIIAESTGIRASIEDLGATTSARTDNAEQALTGSLTEAISTLTASIGYLDDKLNRVLPPEQDADES